MAFSCANVAADCFDVAVCGFAKRWELVMSFTLGTLALNDFDPLVQSRRVISVLKQQDNPPCCDPRSDRV